MNRRLLGWVVSFALAWGPAPLAAEIYRWTDAGGEHFTTDLSQVPPQHRPAARRSATPESPPQPVVERPAVPARTRFARPSAPAAPAPDPMDSEACHQARERVAQLRRKATRVERQVEAAEDSAGNIRLSAKSRAYHQARARRYAAQLLDAQDAVSDYENAMRRRGLPRGCLR